MRDQLLILTSVASLFCVTASAVEWFVSPDGTDADGRGAETEPFRTINYAVGKASANDTIILLPGDHVEGSTSEGDVDMTSLYPGATNVVREITLTKDGLFVDDRLAGLRPGAVVAWNMNVAATARGRTLELKAEDAKGVMKTMAVFAQVEGVEWKVSSIAGPRTPADSPNPGMTCVAFSKAADESGMLDFAVAFALVRERPEVALTEKAQGGRL